MNLSVILPMLNEEELIENSIETIFKYLEKFPKSEIIAIEDGSKDKTLQILNQLKKKYKNLKVIVHKKNKGYGSALRDGIKNSSHDWVFFTDADMQFSIKDLDDLLPFTKDFDFIVGYRKERADANKQKFRSWVYNRLVRILFRVPVRDVDCAFKLMRRSAVSRIHFKSNSFFVSAELMVRVRRKGYRIKEIGVKHLPRIKGQSTVTTKKTIETIIDLIKLRISL